MKFQAIAKGVLGEDDCLLREILFNPRTGGQVSKIRDELKEMLEIIDRKDEEALNKNKTKRTRVGGKFRRFTIDRKDEIFTGAARTVGAVKRVTRVIEVEE